MIILYRKEVTRVVKPTLNSEMVFEDFGIPITITYSKIPFYCTQVLLVNSSKLQIMILKPCNKSKHHQYFLLKQCFMSWCELANGSSSGVQIDQRLVTKFSKKHNQLKSQPSTSPSNFQELIFHIGIMPFYPNWSLTVELQRLTSAA